MKISKLALLVCLIAGCIGNNTALAIKGTGLGYTKIGGDGVPATIIPGEEFVDLERTIGDIADSSAPTDAEGAPIEVTLPGGAGTLLVQPHRTGVRAALNSYFQTPRGRFFAAVAPWIALILFDWICTQIHIL